MTDEGPDSATKTRSEDNEGGASTLSIPLTNDRQQRTPMPPLTTIGSMICKRNPQPPKTIGSA